jgi:hypothetical protein
MGVSPKKFRELNSQNEVTVTSRFPLPPKIPMESI